MGSENPAEPTRPLGGLPDDPADACEAETDVCARGPRTTPRGSNHPVRDWLVMILGGLGFTVGLCLTTPPLVESVDFVLYHQANFEYFRQAVTQFRLPLWNPCIGLGRPFLADVQNAVFYPPAYLVLCGPRLGALLIVWLHAVGALAGMRALGKALAMDRPVAWGVAFSFLLSLPLTGRLMAGQILYFGALCYLPILFRCTLQLTRGAGGRWVGCHALLLALQFLCGHPQVFWFSALGQICFLNARLLAGAEPCKLQRWVKANLQLAGAFLLCAGLAAAVLLPFLELIGQGNRTGGSKEFCDFGRLEWLDLMGLFGDPPQAQLLDWERNLFIGALGVLGGVAGLLRWKDPDARALLVVGLFALLLSAGSQTPVFDGFYRGVPGFSSFRVHARSATLISFVLLLSAGLWLSRTRPSRAAWLSLAAAGGAVLVLVTIHRSQLTCVRGVPFSGWIATAGLALLMFRLQGRDRRRSLQPWILGALALLQAADLLNANLQYKGTYSFLNVQKTSPDFPYRQAVRAALEEKRSAKPDLWLPRVLVPRKVVPANCGMLDGYGNVDAYTSLFLERPWRFLHTVLELPEPRLKNTSLAGEIYERNPFGHPLLAVDVGWDNARRVCLANTNRAPRAFLASQVEVVAPRSELLDRLRRGHDGQKTPLVEETAGIGRHASLDSAGTVQEVSWSSERIGLVVRAPQEALLVLAEPWYPGWKARLGTQVIDAMPANGWMRAFRVPAGEHRIDVFFHQNHLATGVGVSLLSVVVVGLRLAGTRRKPSPPPTSGR